MATPFSPAEQQAIETLRVLNAKASMGAIPSQGSARAYLAAIGAPAFRATVAPKARKRA